MAQAIAAVSWSREHGDLRIPHFFGLHALQIIPFLVWWRGRKRTRNLFRHGRKLSRALFPATWQALRGESIAQPGTATLIALTLWLVGTVFALQPWQRNSYAMEVLHER